MVIVVWLNAFTSRKPWLFTPFDTVDIPVTMSKYSHTIYAVGSTIPSIPFINSDTNEASKNFKISGFSKPF